MDIIFQEGLFYGEGQGVLMTILTTMLGAGIGAGTALYIFYKTTKNEKEKALKEQNHWDESLYSYVESTFTVYIKDVEEGMVRFNQITSSLKDDDTTFYDIGNNPNFKFDQFNVLSQKELQLLFLKKVEGTPENIIALCRNIRDCQYQLRELAKYVTKKESELEESLKSFEENWNNHTEDLLLKINRDNSKFQPDKKYSQDLPEIKFGYMLLEHIEEYKENKNPSFYIRKMIRPMMKVVENKDIIINEQVMEYYDYFTRINSTYEKLQLKREGLIRFFNEAIVGLNRTKATLVTLQRIVKQRKHM